MNIIIKSISLVNFKGFRNKTIEFTPGTNILSGDNATGKTTILDGFLWCLFGKDSTDRKDFEVKTLDKYNRVIERLDHEVELTLEINVKEINIKRILREKWSKKRGTEDTEFTGNETEYYWNDVPMKMSDFNAKINQLIEEGLFKLLSNVTYFHSLHWEKRRDILFSLAGDISETEILESFSTIQNKDQSILVTNILNQGKTLKEAKAEFASKRTKLKEVLRDIPARIDEAERSKPRPLDAVAIQKEIDKHQAEITELNTQIQEIEAAYLDKAQKLETQNKEYNVKLTALYDLRRKADARKAEITNQVRASYSDTSSDIVSLKNETNRLSEQLVKIEGRIDSVNTNISDYTEKRRIAIELWHNANEKTISFDDQHFDCPTCKRELEPEDIDLKKAELVKNFNTAKAAKLNEIKTTGFEIKAKLEDSISLREDLMGDRDTILGQIGELKDKLFQLEAKKEEQKPVSELIQQAIVSDSELKSLEIQIKAAQTEVDLSEKYDNSQDQQNFTSERTLYRERISNINASIKTLEMQLGSSAEIKRIDTRIEELKAQESTLSQELANLEGKEFAILQYEKARTAFIENLINDKFTYVGFKMFETQINGAEVPCCKTLIEGVPYEDANNAAKINAGLDIISALSKHYEVFAPVFVDNAESINKLRDIDSQMIQLQVSHNPELVNMMSVELLESVR